MTLPLIGISACRREINEHPVHSVAAQYVRAALDGARGMAVLLPAVGADHDPQALLDRLDGLLLTGSPSNVLPALYKGPPSRAGTLHDADRDATTLPLIRAAVAMGVPVLGLCRGNQEINVAMGGTLHQNLHEVEGRRDHRSDKTKPRLERYGFAHRVTLTPGGLLNRLTGLGETLVNSLHAQGIDRLAPGLAVEAVSEDGVVEAVRVESAAFALGVQWHPEWHIGTDALCTAVFTAFGDAARARAARRALPAAARVA